MPVIKVEAYQCSRCEHVWRARSTTDFPVICPHCKSPYWNRPVERLTTSAAAKLKRGVPTGRR
jgi:predicted Zn-ribbon and HTH transcriptional regulator